MKSIGMFLSKTVGKSTAGWAPCRCCEVCILRFKEGCVENFGVVYQHDAALVFIWQF